MTSLQNHPQQLNGNELPLKLLRKGKVRDVYELQDKLLIVSSDRISAFDYILPTEIPDKGKVLTQISAFCFEKTKHIISNHVISCDISEINKFLPAGIKLTEWFDKRTMLVKKAKRIDFECVVRGYLAGSGWKDYKKTTKVCGITLPQGLKENQKLPQPIFTPATKADTGHDENVSFAKMAENLGVELSKKIKTKSIELYKWAEDYLYKKGIIIADTKFEFGILNDELILIDEIFTPDSSRFWNAENYKKSKVTESFDKQYVRDFLSSTSWDKNSTPPKLSEEVVKGTVNRYKQALKKIIS